MSLISRCPACKTTFKVVPDQLRISQGWVRCGQCAEIFDGSAHLVGEHLAPTTATGVDQAVQPAEPLPTEKLSVPDVEEQVEPRVDTRVEPELDLTALNGLKASPPVALPDEPPDVPPIEPPIEPRIEPQIEQPDVSFIRKGKGPSVWVRTSVRVLLALLLLGLTGLLAGQWVYRERERIGAMYPQLKTYLVAACEPLKCTVLPWRQIESIAIENSSFTKVRGDTYRLNVGLKNNSPLELAMPAVELTLTDAQDQAVIRRVVSAAELGTVATTLAGESEWAGSVTLNLRSGPYAPAGTGANTGTNPGAGPDRVSGYRVLAFYP